MPRAASSRSSAPVPPVTVGLGVVNPMTTSATAMSITAIAGPRSHPGVFHSGTVGARL